MATQELHLVFGGTLVDPRGKELADPQAVDLVGIYANWQDAYDAWRSKAQLTVDDAYIRYFIAPLHQLMRPDEADNTDT